MTDIDPNLNLQLAISYMHGLTLPAKGQEGYLAYVNADGDNLVYAPPVQDLPPISAGDALKFLRVDTGETTIEWTNEIDNVDYVSTGGTPANSGAVRLSFGEKIAARNIFDTGDRDLLDIWATGRVEFGTDTSFGGSEDLTGWRSPGDHYWGVGASIPMRLSGTALYSTTGANLGASTNRWGVGYFANIDTSALILCGEVSKSWTRDVGVKVAAESAGNTYYEIVAGSAASSAVLFSDENASASGKVQYTHANNTMYFFVNGANTMQLDTLALKPAVDDALDCGAAALRWAAVYAVDVKVSGKIVLPLAGALTISAGAVTVSKGFHSVDTEGGVALDDLDTINGAENGYELRLRCTSASRQVRLTESGNILISGGTTATLGSGEDSLTLTYIAAATKWYLTTASPGVVIA